ncbi:MAG TPA: hypothetical protein VEW48_01300 [Thermoanaerobaculia bacterium]|nr:hypothetical protein [Thermoanaerobaculia bacterium]
MSEPEPDVHRLRQLLDLIEQGSGGHIRRGAGYGDQLRAAISELRTVLNEEELEGQDYKSLFGWTARLLLVRRESARPEPQDHRSDPRERPQSQTPRRPGPRQREERRPAPSPGSGKLSAVGTKSLSTLEKLKRDLEDKEKNGKR